MKKNKRVVIKVGTKVITSAERTLDKEKMRGIARQVSEVMSEGTEVIIVTSGAIAAGMSLIGAKRRSSDLNALQAAASMGQSHLMRLYGEYFRSGGYLVGQMLLTQEDFNDRKRYLNIKHTIDTLFKHGAVPIINENDTVATDEIKCGDNDRLSALVSDLCGADKLIVLTDVEGLLDGDGRLIPLVEEITQKISALGGASRCDLGTGGMASKLESVGRVMSSGIECVIADGRSKDIITRIMRGEASGTVFKSSKARFIAKKRWIAFSSKPKGSIKVDDGAVDALTGKNRSLLAKGIIGVSGHFKARDTVRITDKLGNEFGRGLCNYSSAELSKIKGLGSDSFAAALGYGGRDEVIHKDELVIL